MVFLSGSSPVLIPGELKNDPSHVQASSALWTFLLYGAALDPTSGTHSHGYTLGLSYQL